jgi:ATP-dependent DNA helicase DinG
VSLDQLFGDEGGLSSHLSGFKPRPAQQEMAAHVLEAIESKKPLVAEAGTGTGKTLAYLLPAVLSGKRIIVSTATKTLQDQLFLKDLPVVRKTINRPFKTALLKGRNNYLCLYRLDNNLGARGGMGPLDLNAIEGIRRWSKTTQSGDISEAHEVPESSPHWSYATSTKDNCLGQECPQYSDCYLIKARSRAREADVLVINHHILWADWTLRNDGFGELLPEADAIIVDEAHQFLESAAQFLGSSFTSRHLLDLADDIAIARFKEAPDVVELLDEAERLERLVLDLRFVMGDDSRREPWQAIAYQEPITSALQSVAEQLYNLAKLLTDYSARGKSLEACQKRANDLLIRLNDFLANDSGDDIKWFETRKKGFSFNRTPLDISDEFTQFRRSRETAWIFASATLTVANKFDHFVQQLGLSDAVCRSWESPFDYAHNSLLYLPESMPDPSSRDFNWAVVTAIIPVLKASQGRAFVLFTSHAALALAAKSLGQHLDFPLFIQGTQPKSRLLESFKSSGNGILLGTSTFWEGVDVPGPALSCVIIDKLPFASPSDPVLEARLNHLKSKGFNPFVQYQLPSAIIALKQGVGRLIRDYEDRGILMICDPRIIGKPYGKQFLNSLPCIPLTRASKDVELFYASIRTDKP